MNHENHEDMDGWGICCSSKLAKNSVSTAQRRLLFCPLSAQNTDLRLTVWSRQVFHDIPLSMYDKGWSTRGAEGRNRQLKSSVTTFYPQRNIIWNMKLYPQRNIIWIVKYFSFTTIDQWLFIHSRNRIMILSGEDECLSSQVVSAHEANHAEIFTKSYSGTLLRQLLLAGSSFHCVRVNEQSESRSFDGIEILKNSLLPPPPLICRLFLLRHPAERGTREEKEVDR